MLVLFFSRWPGFRVSQGLRVQSLSGVTSLFVRKGMLSMSTAMFPGGPSRLPGTYLLGPYTPLEGFYRAEGLELRAVGFECKSSLK